MSFDKRAAVYDKLNWTQDQEYMDKLLKACHINSEALICDAGTGTGVVAYELSKYCKRVVAVDSCKRMLDIAKKKRHRKNIDYAVHDIKKGLAYDSFDCVVARMVFHHIQLDKSIALKLSKFVKPGGRFVVAEGIPQEGTEIFYENMFEIKEERNTYTLDRLVWLIDYLKNIEIVIHHQKDMSINNWLVNSGLPKGKQKKIFDLHLDAPGYVKDAYNMRFVDGDIIMDWRTAIVSGEK